MKKIILILLILACVLSCFSCSSTDVNKEDTEGNKIDSTYIPRTYTGHSVEEFLMDFSNYRHGNFSEYDQGRLVSMENSGFHSLNYTYIPKVNVSTHSCRMLTVETDRDAPQAILSYLFQHEDPNVDPILGKKNYERIHIAVYQNWKVFAVVLEEYESARKDIKDFKKTVISDTVCCYEYGGNIVWAINLKNPYSTYAYVQIEKKDLNLFCPNGITDYDNFISFDFYNVVDGELVKAE